VLLLLAFSTGLTLFLAVSLLYTARYFLRREAALVDRLLKQNGIQPVVIEREKVVKLPDPELAPMSAEDEAFFVDDIKEELEQIYPEIARMSHTEAKRRYAGDWARMQKRLQAERAPLRAD